MSRSTHRLGGTALALALLLAVALPAAAACDCKPVAASSCCGGTQPAGCCESIDRADPEALHALAPLTHSIAPEPLSSEHDFGGDIDAPVDTHGTSASIAPRAHASPLFLRLRTLLI